MTVSNEEKTRIWFHPLRLKLVDLLRKRGSMTQTELARAVVTEPASARYHLLKLVRGGFVEQSGTRPGPKGITEKLFQLTNEETEPMTMQTKHGSKLDNDLRKLNFDNAAEVHRVGERIALREPERFFGLRMQEIEAPPEKLRALRDALRHTLNSFLAGLESNPDEPNESVTLCINFYPRKAD